MLLRSRPDGSAAAARVASLLPAAGGGWLPPPEPPPGAQGWSGEVDVPAGEVAAYDGDRGGDRDAYDEGGATDAAFVGAAAEDSDPAGVDGGPSADGAGHDDAEPPDAARSWGRPRSHALDTPRYRLDPGRRGVAALLLVALVAALGAAGVVVRGRPQEVAVPLVEAAGVPLPGASSSTAPAPSGEVVVAVAGKVRSPGLVRLPAGSRVDDAVRAAGGPAAGADIGLLNLARTLVDGEQVLVGVDPPPGAAPGGSGSASGGLLDLNAASASDLDALPGIGPVLAQRIVDWRTENGRFASVDQLREVTGIGEAKYQDLEAKVTV